MINVLVKKNGKVIEKSVYAGDDESSRAIIQKQRIQNQDLDYVEVDDATFLSAAMEKEKTKKQKDWEDLKAAGALPAQLISFIAAHLGLE